MNELTGKVAVVTGASRGVGRGVASVLAEKGATVYATGRSIMDSNLRPEIIRVTCDHRDEETVSRFFQRVDDEKGKLDILVNCAWPGYERMVEDGQFNWPLPFWKQPLWRWESMITGGVRSAFISSQHAARRMVSARGGLIVNLSYWAAQKHIGNTIYGISKAATDKLTADTAHELRPHNVTVISLYPGLVRTEAVLSAGVFDLTNSESPEFTGRAIAALALDPSVLEKSGSFAVVADLASEYHFRDIDGKQPKAFTFEDA